LMESLAERLRQLRESGGPAVLIASAHPTLFCPGWDLKQLRGASRDEVAATLTTFNRLILALFSYPGPTAAAISGHAVAGGCLLCLACDLRIMATGAPRLGLAELNLGVPVPAGSLRMLQVRLRPDAVEDLVLRGDGCTADKARELGLVFRAVPPNELLSTTDRELGKLASKSPQAFAATKQVLFEKTWQDMESDDRRYESQFVECWFDQQTLQRIAEVARSLSPP